jgi:predicted XRE-type DNA-binding protein
MNYNEPESGLYFKFIECLRLRTRLTELVKKSKEKRKRSQKEISEDLQIALTKIKEIEKGSCKDFNAINNYINFFGYPLI